jgi:hypothetical protein
MIVRVAMNQIAFSVRPADQLVDQSGDLGMEWDVTVASLGLAELVHELQAGFPVGLDLRPAAERSLLVVHHCMLRS